VEAVQSEEYMSQSPYLTPNAVEWLIKKKIKLLGIDFWSIEAFPIDSREGEKGHIALFTREIPLIHSLVNLIKLSSNRIFFVALPLPIKGLDSSPVRAVAIET
jgi:arylformamidase